MNSWKKFVVLLALVFLLTPVSVSAGEKWLGTDDLVDKKMKETAGVSKTEPLIDISQGNLGLFLFAGGGFAAGVVVGYQWRVMFGERAGKHDD
ncbi:MAG TPA: hypothetical protein VNT57_04845 [Desulfobacteria bacterium]|nr:hypothetical protein [Desulfobacteria bacterium]